MQTQKQKVLKVLVKRGEKGLHSFWGYKNYIPRLGAVIWELKNEGYKIKSIRKGDSGCTYFLEE